MELNDFIADFADQFEDTELEEITADSDFRKKIKKNTMVIGNQELLKTSLK